MPTRPHEQLQVWQDAMDLVERVYQMTRGFPRDEQFGLTSQLRRAAVSVPSNIAEGAARRSRPEYLHFLSIARGSLSELDTQCKISARLGFAGQEQVPADCINKVFAKLNALIRSLQRTQDAP